jgi:hypothetical protein
MCLSDTPVWEIDSVESLPRYCPRVCEGTTLHPDPFVLVDTDKIAACAPDLTPAVYAVIFEDPVLPAVQDPALTDLPVLEDLCLAPGTSYREHGNHRIIQPTP